MSLEKEIKDYLNSFYGTKTIRPDYTTNSKSYYDYLEKVTAVLVFMSRKIDEYEGTLNDELKNIKNVLDSYITILDGKLETFDESVITLLVEWLNDGVLSEIINEEIFGYKLDTEIFNNFKEETTSLLNDIYINVKAHGVDSTGIIDVTEKVQLIIDNAPNGSIVYFPIGQYKFTKPLIIPRGISLIGSDATFNGGSILRFELSSEYLKGTGMIQISSNVRNVKIKNLYIRDYKSTTHYYDGISNIGNTGYNVGLEFENLQIVNTRYGINLTHIYLSSFKELHTTQTDIGYHFDGFSTSLYFEHCYAVQSSQDGYRLGGVIYSTFVNCIAEQCELVGFNLIRCENITMIGTGTESINLTAIKVEKSTCITIENLYGLLNGSTNSTYGTMVQINTDSTYVTIKNVTEMELSPNHERQYSIVGNFDCHGEINNVRTLLPVNVGNNILLRGQYMGNNIPTNGGHFKGKIVYNKNIAEGQPIGWICINTEPFEWRALQSI